LRSGSDIELEAKEVHEPLLSLGNLFLKGEGVSVSEFGVNAETSIHCAEYRPE
jgi:hypothetical protein